MAISQRLENRLIGLWLYVLRRFARRPEGVAPSVYLAFSIGSGFLAIGVQKLDVQNDADALEKAAPLFHNGLKRLEVWCGVRKVGEIAPPADYESASN